MINKIEIQREQTFESAFKTSYQLDTNLDVDNTLLGHKMRFSSNFILEHSDCYELTFNGHLRPIDRKFYLKNMNYFRNNGLSKYIEKPIRKENSRIPFYVMVTDILITYTVKFKNLISLKDYIGSKPTYYNTFIVNDNKMLDLINYVLNSNLTCELQINNAMGTFLFKITIDELINLIKIY